MSRVLPILFNTDMVQAILNGKKTMTRRVVHNGKLYPQYCKRDKFYGVVDHLNNDDKNWYAGFYNDNDVFTDSDGNEQIDAIYFKAPYKPGDILYVRETWNHYIYDDLSNGTHKEGYFYKANPEMKSELPDYVQCHFGEIWRPSIHMPKEAARIWLKVTGVRVERLQEITIDGIRNEGLNSMAVHAGDIEIAQEEFKLLWNSTIKTDIDRYGWDANPFVWAIGFERCEKPKEVEP